MRPSRPLALAALAALSTAFPLVPRQTCATGFHILVARGSTEAAGEGRPAEVAMLIEAGVAGSDDAAIDYPATLDNYAASVAAGVTNTISQIHAYVAACGASSRIVLVGYSQGGEVMTDTLAGGTAKPPALTEQYRKNIAGVVVFGDPTHTARQSYDVGTSTNDGIFTRRGNATSLTLLKTYSSVLRDYCDRDDPFCADGGNLTVHYNEVPKYAQQAANFIISLA